VIVVGRLCFKGEICFALLNYDCDDNALNFIRLAEMSRDNCGLLFLAILVKASLHIMLGISYIVSNEFIKVFI
jgi:hypothetical protein